MLATQPLGHLFSAGERSWRSHDWPRLSEAVDQAPIQARMSLTNDADILGGMWTLIDESCSACPDYFNSQLTAFVPAALEILTVCGATVQFLSAVDTL